MAFTHTSIIACLASLLGEIIFCKGLHAQLIVPSQDGVGTSILQNGNVFNIEGGVTSRNGANLFHSFQKFGLDASQTANFRSDPGIQNIISRDVGGAPSLINGLLQVTGSNANLFLINPAGILLGSSARLNVPAAFTVTTANGISFGFNWFNAVGSNDYTSLVSPPSSFAFTMSQPGIIVNAGNLTVGSGQQLTLLGGTVINTGQLSAPGGQITIAAVPGEKLVRISQQGSLLSLELQALASPSPLAALPFSPLSLPQLLTGGGSHVTGVTIENGIVKLVGSGVTISTAPGTAIVSNQINVSGAKGGAVQVLGSRVGLVNATIDASGTQGGGTVLIGGDYQGRGTVPTAISTFVNQNSVIEVSALQQGDGGQAIVWSDRLTQFDGLVNARGGARGGNGGFVEVSGKQGLVFQGLANLNAAQGTLGTLLLDPQNIRIVNGDNGANDAQLGNGQILLNDFSGTTLTISERALERLAAMAQIKLQADQDIKIDPLVDRQLALPTRTGVVEFLAGNQFSMCGGAGGICQDRITTQGAGLRIQAGNRADIGGIEAGGSIELVSDRLNFLGGPDAIRPTSGIPTQVSLRPVSQGRLVRVEDNNSSTDKNDAILDIHVRELAAIQQQNFTQLAIQGDDIDITRDFPDGTPILPFQTKLVLEARNTVSIDDSIIPRLTVPSLVIRASNIVLPSVPGVIQTTSGSVTLGTPRNANQNIVVGASSTALAGDLNITQQNLDAITTPVLQSLTFETGGNITVTQPITTNADLNFLLKGNLTLLQPAVTNGGNFSVDTAGTIQLENPVRTQGGNITLSGGTVRTGLLDLSNLSGQGGVIDLQAQAGSVVTGDLNSSGQQGGRITVKAPAGITTGAISSNGSIFSGGAVDLSTISAINVSSINTQGGAQGTGGDIGVEFVNAQGGDVGRGGKVDVSTNGRFRAQGTFLVDGVATSIATRGGLGGGDIRIQVAGNQLNVPFTVGDASINGTQGAISTGTDNVILPQQVISGDFTQTGRSGTIQITSGRGVIPVEPPSPSSTIPLGDLSTILSPNLIPPLPLSLPDENIQRLSDIQRTLQQLEIDKGIRPALIYVGFLPMPLQNESRQFDKPIYRHATETQFFFQSAPLKIPEYQLMNEQTSPHLVGYSPDKPYKEINEPNRLELLMVTSKGVYSQPFCLDEKGAAQTCIGYWGDSYDVITEKIQELQNCFNSPRFATKEESWRCARSASKLLYKRLLEPLESNIVVNAIDNIAFVMPVGLRQIPIAALLYDDQQGNEQSILTKKYSIGLIPSMTDTLIWPKRGMQESNLLALGVSKFHDGATALSGVENELKQVQQAWTKDRHRYSSSDRLTLNTTSGGQFINSPRAIVAPEVHELHNENVTVSNWGRARQDKAFPLVHLATHAHFEQEQPDNSQLWLGNRTLTFKDFQAANLHIPRIELLILSACSTASSSDSSDVFEYGFAGLAHELGVKSVLASLWLANDQQTGDKLMPRFYTNLRTSATKAEALRKAQLSLYKDPDLDPRYWAGFVLVGSPW